MEKREKESLQNMFYIRRTCGTIERAKEVSGGSLIIELLD